MNGDLAAATASTFWGLLEAAPGAILVTGKDGLIQLVSDQTLSLFGYARSELIGQPVEVLLPERFRSAHLVQRNGYFGNPKTRAMGTGLELLGRRKDGTEFSAEISLMPTQSADGVFVAATVRDITERKKTQERIRAAEERLRQLWKVRVAAPYAWRPLVVAIALIAVASTLRLWPLHSLGARLAWLTFYPAVMMASFYGGVFAGLLGTVLSCLAVLFLLPVFVDQPFIRDFADYLGMGVFAATCTMFSGISEAMHRARARATNASDQLGASVHQLEGEILRRRDVEVEIRRLNEKLERGVAELASANRELESFSYSVAHDLRAPLRGMNGFAQVLLDSYGDKLDADGRDALQEILLNARRMGALIDALLSLSRVTRSALNPESIDLSAVARATASQLSAAEPDRSVELVIQDNLRAELDPILARTLIENILGNAWKFTSKVPAPRIDVGATEKDGIRAFYVRDNGAGFDMAFANKLFAPFQRLHTVAEFPGTGIGLATVQRIVHRHGGRLWAEGAVEGGASFYLAFPRRESGGT